MNLITDGFTQPEGARWIPLWLLIACVAIIAALIITYRIRPWKSTETSEVVVGSMVVLPTLAFLSSLFFTLPAVTPATSSSSIVETPSGIAYWDTADAKTNAPIVTGTLRDRYGITIEQYRIKTWKSAKTVSSLDGSNATLEDVTFYGHDKAGQDVKCKVDFDGQPTSKGRPAHPVCSPTYQSSFTTPKAIR